MSAQSQTFEAELSRMVGPENLRPGVPEDAIAGRSPKWIVEPGTGEELALALQAADRAGLKVAARGNGTKLGWGNPPSGLDLVFSTRRLDKVLEHAAGDMTATVQPGVNFSAL